MVHPTSSRRSDGPDQARLNALDELVSYRVDELFAALGIRARRSGKMYAGCCPVHGGDKADAWNLYPDGHTRRGNWVCRSRKCQTVFWPTLIGLTRGVMSAANGWNPDRPKERMAPFHKAVNWLCDFVGQRLSDIKVDDALNERRRFVSQMAALGKTPEVIAEGWQPEAVRARLQCPSPYFLGRGFSAEVLDRHCVGEPLGASPTSPMFGRAVVPVFDAEHRRVIGFTGRSMFERCGACELWHPPETACASLLDAAKAKWRHEGFRAESVLYNLGRAASEVRRTSTIALCEGPGDVWRMEEAGVGTAVAMFGVHLSDQQQVLVESSGAMSVVLFLDMDEAGRAAVGEIRSRLGRMFRVYVPELTVKDVGEMTAAAARAELAPLMEAARLGKRWGGG